jgi:hypothetical protein
MCVMAPLAHMGCCCCCSTAANGALEQVPLSVQGLPRVFCCWLAESTHSPATLLRGGTSSSLAPSSYFTSGIYIEKTRPRNIFWSTAFRARPAAPLDCSRVRGVGNFNEFSYFNYASGRRCKKVPSAALKSRVSASGARLFCNCSAALAPNLR